MISRTWIISLMLLSLLLSMNGCTRFTAQRPTASKSVVKPVGTKEALWQRRQQQLARTAAWSLNSKIALRYRADHWTFGLNWVQKAMKQYVMNINNPVTGAVVAKLSRTNQGVSLLSDDGKTYKDTDEERLLLKQSGVRLPLKGMQHWVRGLPSPLYKVDKVLLDSMGRPQKLFQAGWEINYSRYINNNFDAMPRKVVISRNKDSVYLKMVAKQWR